MWVGSSYLFSPCDIINIISLIAVNCEKYNENNFTMYDRGSRVRFPAGVGSFSLHHYVQNGPGAHAASYPMGTRGSFLGGKASGV
jgi:hypothetical protein